MPPGDSAVEKTRPVDSAHAGTSPQESSLSREVYGHPDTGYIRAQFTTEQGKIIDPAFFENLGKDLDNLFTDLDQNQDGKVTARELNAALEDGSYDRTRIHYIMALRSCFGFIKEQHELDPSSPDGITSQDISTFLENWRTNASSGHLFGKLRQNAELFQDALLPSPFSLYANPERPLESITPEACIQISSNCHLVAAMADLAKINPQAIKDMIQVNDNGTYTVTFPGDQDHPVTVSAPTTQELERDLDQTKHGMWSAVLQKAYARYWYPDAMRELDEAAGSERDDGLRKLLGYHMKLDELDYTSYAVMNRHLKEAFAEGRPMIAGIDGDKNSSRTPTLNLPRNHACSVLAYESNDSDPKNSMITIRDPNGPWSKMHSPSDSQFSNTTTDTVRITLDQFCKDFSVLSYASRPDTRTTLFSPFREDRDNYTFFEAELAALAAVGGYTLATRFPIATSLGISAWGMGELYHDYNDYRKSTSTTDTWKYGIDTVSDLAITAGAIARLVPAGRSLGFAAIGLGLAGRIGSEFI